MSIFLARVGRPDNLWSVNKLARAVTKWTKACDKRLACLISYIHHTCEYKQHCNVGNTAQQCRTRLFQDSDFAGDLQDSKSTSRSSVHFQSRTFVPTSWMCKKETSISHSSCGEVEDVVGALTPVVGGVAQVFHDLLVELRLLLVAEVEEGEEEDRQEEGEEVDNNHMDV